MCSCPQCNSASGIAIVSPSPWITFTLGTPTPPPTPAEQLAKEARELAKEGKDLGPVTYAIDNAKREHQRSIERSLDNVVELSKLSESGKTRVSKEFMLVYQAHNGEAKTIRGVDFDTRDDKSKDVAGYARVILDVPCGGEPVGKFLWSMKNLKDNLADKNILYRIAYID